ncbi:MAG TPA: chemotaxis protein CheW, partial [Burkholderiaceae bacterium]
MTTPTTPAALAFLPYMPDVARTMAALQELHQLWSLIDASAKIHCPAQARSLLPAIASTRTGFAHLEQALVSNLVQEKLRNAHAGLATRARYAIDLLVRNLFERTADIGFLATDDALRRYAAGLDADTAAASGRLAAYRAKYTVYSEIAVMAPDGTVLVHADQEIALPAIRDALVPQCLQTEGHVETFRASDLRPASKRALIYSQRMLRPDGGAVAGVLSLCFDVEQEMAAIFDAYRDPQGRMLLLLLDGERRVIASSDALWLPPGAALPHWPDDPAEPVLLAGRAYLAAHAASAGYQGYPGPAGWHVQVLAPLDLAFGAQDGDVLRGVAPGLMRGLLSHADTFSPPLHALLGSVQDTTRTIARIVWNGKVTTAAGDDLRLHTVLDQIADTGGRSDALFSASIRALFQTVLAASVATAENTAQLLVDMLDRNLYERANDCRWWALAAPLRAGLAAPDDADAVAAMIPVLEAINALYTVYSRLYMYDAEGRVLASTGAQDF